MPPPPLLPSPPPLLLLLLATSGAALVAGLGALAPAGAPRGRAAWPGWALALAAGLMTGVAYTLTAVEPVEPWPAALGALAGILLIAWSHRITGTGELELDRVGELEPTYGWRVGLVHTLHAASEGVTIGAAAAASLPFGLFTAGAMAVHNVPEAAVLAAIRRSRGGSPSGAACLGVATNLPQPLLAVSTFALIGVVPGALPWTLGFATGALVNLVLVELLPDAYRRAGTVAIALVASVALGLVALLQGWAG